MPNSAILPLDVAIFGNMSRHDLESVAVFDHAMRKTATLRVGHAEASNIFWGFPQPAGCAGPLDKRTPAMHKLAARLSTGS
jgi:hypothetical protein